MRQTFNGWRSALELDVVSELVDGAAHAKVHGWVVDDAKLGIFVRLKIH